MVKEIPDNLENLETSEQKFEALSAGVKNFIAKQSSVLEQDQKALEALQNLYNRCTRG